MNQSKIKYTKLTKLPYSFITEQAILNILLTNSFVIKKTVSILKIESFYFEPHRLIYEIICELYEKNRLINVTTIISNLQDKQLLTKIGGIDRIILILNRFENFINVDEYIQIINEKYLQRLIIEFGKQIIAWGYNSSLKIDEIFQKIENGIFQLNEQKVSEKIYSVGEIIDDIFLEMKSKLKKNENFNLKSSFLDLDSIIQGFEKSDLIIIAGRPSMGKTAFSLNLGKNIVEKYKIPLIIFSLEMSRQQILYRFISSQSKINMSRLKSGKMTMPEWEELSLALKEISKLPIFIDDNPEINLGQIRSKIKKIFTNKKNGIVIIDYLQLMKSNFKIENRVQEISHITRNLKIIAKEFGIPIFVLSQLSRGLESRLNKRPMLSDLRESGCIKDYKKLEKIQSWKTNILYPTKVSNIELKGLKPTYIITFENNVQISLTANHRLLSKRGWLKILEATKNSEFCFIQNQQNGKKKLKYCKLKSIQYGGLNKVYEKTIPIYHNYIYENLILHNSIEQDADIVIMLYREDYYNEKNKNNQITELIVAKHRNGPVGTARLMFNPYLTKFTTL